MKKLLAVLVVAICLLSFGFAKTYITADPYVDGCITASVGFGTDGFKVNLDTTSGKFKMGWDVSVVEFDIDISWTEDGFDWNKIGASNDYVGFAYYKENHFTYNPVNRTGLGWFNYYDDGKVGELILFDIKGLGLKVAGQDDKLAMKGGWGFIDTAMALTFDATKLDGAYVEATVNPLANLNVYAGFGADFDPNLYAWYAGASYAFDFDFLTVTPEFYWDSEVASGTVAANGPGKYAKVSVGLDFDPFTLSSWFKYDIAAKLFSLEAKPELDMDWLFVGAKFGYTQKASPTLAAIVDVNYDFTDFLNLDVKAASGKFTASHWANKKYYIGNLLGADSFKDLSVKAALTVTLPVGMSDIAITPYGGYYIAEKYWKAGADVKITLWDALDLTAGASYDQLKKFGWNIGGSYTVCF